MAFPADGGLKPPASNPECDVYCTTVQEQCRGTSTIYGPNSGECAALCPHFVRTGEGQRANTLACRMNQANRAVDATEKYSYCDAASRMGETEFMPVCGSACEAYCQLMSSVCPDQFASDDVCQRECEGLANRGNFHAGNCVQGGDERDGASVQCRMWHVGAAAIALSNSDEVERGRHCGHAAGESPCVGERDTTECVPRAIEPLPAPP